MTKKEVAQILAYLGEIYPNGKSVTELTVNVWHSVIGDYDYEMMWNITKEVAKEWDGYTMPPPSVLIKKAKEISGSTEIELWNESLKAMRNSRYMTKDEFEKLPKPIQMYFGSVGGLRGYAQIDESQIMYEKSTFLKTIGTIKERIKSEEALPEHVVKMLEGI